MTEDEAKTKWCPFVRYVTVDGTAFDNRPAGRADEPLCIASACMAWRNNPFLKGGWCGLAGVPQE